jgi:hypothetical protein
LIASNQLVELYKSEPDAVVEALINSIIGKDKDDDPLSYRVNLYIAFTLARIRGGWRGMPTQYQMLASLRDSKNYQDDTFRQRVDGALSNYQR